LKKKQKAKEAKKKKVATKPEINDGINFCIFTCSGIRCFCCYLFLSYFIMVVVVSVIHVAENERLLLLIVIL